MSSTPAWGLTSRWSSDGSLKMFYITDLPGWGLSSQVRVRRSLYLSPLISTVWVGCADPCFQYPQLTDSKNLYSCSLGGPGRAQPSTSWSLALTASTSAFIGVHRFQEVVSLDLCNPVQETLIFRPLKLCHPCYLAALQSVVPSIYAHAAEWSWICWCCLVEIGVAGFECGNDVGYRHYSPFWAVPFWRWSWSKSNFSWRGILFDNDELEFRLLLRGGDFLSIFIICRF